MELNTIQTEGPWNEIAEALNDNFSKIGVAIKSGTGGGGEGGSVSEELEKQVDKNTSNISSNKTKITQLQNQVTVLNSNDSTNGSVRNLIKSALQGYVPKEDGKGLSTEDFTTTLKDKLSNLENYDDTAISNAVNQLQVSLNTLLNSNPNDAINSFNEIIAFLEGIEDSEGLDSIIASIEQQIADLGEALGQEVSNQMRNYYTKEAAQEVFASKTDVEKKQDKLYSGVNIATINGHSLLDGGDINISGGGASSAVVVNLPVSTFNVGGQFNITETQLNAILQARGGNSVVVKDSANTSNDSEWGQVMSCYRQYMGSSIYAYRLSVMHNDSEPMSSNAIIKMYYIDIMDYPSSGEYGCTVVSVKTL